MSKSFYSAIVVIPPEYLWPQIQNIRKKYDKAYNTWMPHINLMFPFIKCDDDGLNFREAAKYISNQLPHGIKSFKIKFTQDSIQHFSQGKTCTVHLRPFVVDEVARTEVKRITSENDVNLAWSAAKKKPRASRWAPIESSDESGEDKLVSENPMPPGSHPEPMNVESTVRTIQVTYIAPAIPIPAAFQNLPAASLSSLKDAVWSEDDVLEDKSWRLGLSSVDVPQLGGGTVTTYKNVQVYSGEKRNGPRAAADQIVNDDPWKPIDDWVEPEQGPELQDVHHQDPSEVWIKAKTRQPTKKKQQTSNQNQCSTNLVHRNLKQLQMYLERMYPDFCEQSRKGSGFQPHLTLGQCDASDIHRFTKDLKEEWEDIVFDVTEIHLISRPGRDEAHVIRETVKLHA